MNDSKQKIIKSFKRYNTINSKEINAVTKVLKTGVLSAFLGAPGDAFLGGKEVQAFEKKAKDYFNVKHAITVNSWTSGLVAAVGALSAEPGDEIITTPWTMAATATAILHWNMIPVFADIDPYTYNIDPSSVVKLISKKTKAILSVDIFGQSADMDSLNRIAKKYKIKIISDSAQAPGVYYKKKYASTIADIGGFSLNYHKHIHCGEGGILVTNNDTLANKLRLIRNHAEVVIDRKTKKNELINMLGHNFRMGEIEAAIASIQLKKLKANVKSRQRAADQLNKSLSSLPGLIIPYVAKKCTHAYYMYAIQIDRKIIKTPRKKIFQALVNEGVPALQEGYQNIHLLPVFQHKIAYGSKNFPWVEGKKTNNVSYKKGICPIAENLHDNTMLGISLCMYEFNKSEINLVIEAFKKVWYNKIIFKT